MNFYFTLQLKRYSRYLKDAGFNPYITSFSLIAIFILLSHLFFVKVKFAEYTYPFLAIIYLYKLGNKNRNSFLKNCFNIKNYRQIRLIENAVISFPFSLFLIYKEAYVVSLFFFLFSLLLSLINSVKSFSIVMPTPFSKHPFEFIVGFRKSFIIFMVAYILSAISVKVGNFNLGIFAMLLTFLTCMNFYSNPEPEYYVWIHSKNPKDFLANKIKTALQFSLFISLPIVILLFCFNLNKAIYILPFELIGMLYVVNNILSKYAYYPSKNNINHAFVMVASVLFPPLMLLTIPLFYSRSKQQLNSILK